MAIPNVSVIIPTYNRAEYITQAIDSVLAQTYTDYEIIVVDDGSTDNTQEVLEPYMDKITYIYQENTGVSAARNTGICAALGQWIAFLDSDDVWQPEKLTFQMRCVERTGVKVCFTHYSVQRRQGQPRVSQGHSEQQVEEQIFDEPFELILRDSFCLCIPTMLIEKKLLEYMGCFDERLKVAEDTRLIYDLAFEVPFAFIDGQLTVVNRTDERQGLVNDSADTRRSLCDAHIRIVSDAYFCCRGKDITIVRKLRRMLGYLLSAGAVKCCVSNDSSGARFLAKDALHFGGSWSTYKRALAVLFYPRLIRRRQKKQRKA